MHTVTTNLWHKEDEQTGHAGCNDHEDSQCIGSINEEVDSQDKTQRSPNANKDHHNVHGDTDKPRVIDVEVLDISALIGQEQTKHNQQSFVHVQCSNQVAILLTGALLIHKDNVIVAVLIRLKEGTLDTHSNN